VLYPVYVAHEQSVEGLTMNGSTSDPVHASKPIRRRHGHAKQPLTSSSSSAAASSAGGGGGGGGMEKTKNAVMLLNELQPRGLRYDGVTKSGPDHKPVYTAKITVYGQVRTNQPAQV